MRELGGIDKPVVIGFVTKFGEINELPSEKVNREKCRFMRDNNHKVRR